MSQPLRQNTATTMLIGPFIAATDGFTRQTTLALTGTGMWFGKLGGAFALGTSTATLAGGTNGWYIYTNTTANVDTAGRLVSDYNATGSAISLPVWQNWIVETALVYDSLRSGTDNLQIDVIQINGNTVTATGTLFPADVIQWVHNPMASATGTTPNVNLTVLNGNAVTATGTLFPADVIQWSHQNVTTATSGNPQVDVRLLNGATFVAFDVNVTQWTGQTIATSTGVYPNVNADQVGKQTPQTATDIANAVWDMDATPHQTSGSFGQAIGDPGAGLNSIWALTNTNLDAPVSSVSPGVMAEIVEGTTTVVESLRGMNSANMGNVIKNTTTGDIAIRDIANSKDRIQAGTSASSRTVTNRDLTP